jgi:inosine-uridine nucleoside N-ribohydrolase
MPTSNPEKIILDIDNALTIPAQDTDDAMALALALVSPEVELLGCTTCAGNCRTRQSTVNTLRMLEIGDVHHVPVAGGREAPFLRDRESHFKYLERKTAGREKIYWDKLPAPPDPTRSPSALRAHEFLIETIRSHPNQVTVVCLGSFTNLALALLVAPDLAKDIKQVVHMGGSFESDADPPFVWRTPDIPDEIWRTTLRFNTVFDPEASAVVLRAGIPMTLVTANVTTRVFQYRRDMDRILEADTPFHRHLYRWGKPWVEWSEKERRLPGAHMHDPLTLGFLIHPDFCRLEEMWIDVQSLLTETPGWLKPECAEIAVRAAVDVDVTRFESFLSQRLTSQILSKYGFL